MSAPYAVLWFFSQIALSTCFAMILPVFANVILAFRGPFSVIMGAALSYFSIHGFDAKMSQKHWMQRALAALLMIIAITIYSFSTTNK